MLGGADAKSAFVQQGLEWLNENRINDLEILVRRLIEEAVRPTDPLVAGWTSFFQGQVDSWYHRFASAQQSFQQALRLGESSPPLRAHSLLALGKNHYLLSEHVEAERHIRDALSVYREIGNELGEANCLDTLCDIEYQLDHYADALDWGKLALASYIRRDDKLGQANSLRSLGSIRLILSEREAGIELMQKSLELYREIKDKRGEAYVLLFLAEHDDNDHTAVKGLAEEALAIFHEVGDIIGQVQCMQVLGHVALASDDPKLAREQYGSALHLAQGIGYKIGVAMSDSGLGRVDSHVGDHTSALARIEAARSIYKQNGDRFHEAQSLFDSGDVYRRRSDVETALSYYRQAKNIFVEIKSRQGEEKMENAIAELLGDSANHHQTD
jgi:tetratricopeptide (TPR) repeat protein